jgi:membrane associated rhomboid family serine protease
VFFPYGTDAPIYHWPIVTVAMIVVNVLVFCALLTQPELVTSLVLTHGDGLHPVQWVASNFVHGGIIHLVGNMVSLWSFGLVIEGKLGWYKALAVYLGIGAVQCAIEQVVMLGAGPGVSFGASAIVYGLMAMSLIWAPENEMHCILVLFLHPIQCDVPIKVMCGLLFGLELVGLAFAGMELSSAALHLMGGAVGLALALGMLKAKLVDCECWDIFSVWKGLHTMSREDRQRAEAESPERQQERRERLERRRAESLAQIRQVIADDQPALALAAHQRMTREIPDWALPEPDLLGLIRAFHQKKLWVESMPAMAEYLSRYAEKSSLVRLKLAQILVVEANRPWQALKVLAKLDLSSLDSAQQELFKRLQAKARKLHEEDPYEVADEDW